MTGTPTWHFPPRNGGIDFVQDPSSAHFSDDPIPKMVRELIQNSLDARQPGRDGHPIVVTFTDTKVPSKLIRADQLPKHVAECLRRSQEQNHTRVSKMYEKALQTLKPKTIRCLRITDTNTTGLQGTKWDALVIQEGAVQKSSNVGSPGGSYGIGKNAVFNVSDIQTVFYSTKYVDEIKEGRVEKLQGKATLMSHPDPADNKQPLQHIGFYMSSNRNAVLSPNIPEFFKLDENGTGVYVMGFNPRSDNWTRDVQVAVIENFFHAIHHKRLQVRISSPDADPIIEITHETIDHLFDVTQSGSKRDAYHYYAAIRDEAYWVTPIIGNVGALHVYVRTGAGPRRTAYVNRNGMLITASREQKVNPIAPKGNSLWPDYAAVVTPASDEGDQWIREMEPPSHDSISPGQLDSPDEIRIAQTRFQQARRTIRELIDRKAEIDKHGDISNLDELAAVFPDFDSTQEGNRALHVRQVEHRKVSDRTTDESQTSDIGQVESSEIQDGGVGYNHSPGPGGGVITPRKRDTQEPGDDTEKQSKRPKQGPVRRALIGSPRVIHTGDREAVVAFTSLRDEAGVPIELIPAGEEVETQEHMNIEHVTVLNGENVLIDIDNGLMSATLQTGHRVMLRVTTTERIAGLALNLR